MAVTHLCHLKRVAAMESELSQTLFSATVEAILFYALEQGGIAGRLGVGKHSS